jgi:hypothetical protein
MVFTRPVLQTNSYYHSKNKITHRVNKFRACGLDPRVLITALAVLPCADVPCGYPSIHSILPNASNILKHSVGSSPGSPPNSLICSSSSSDLPMRIGFVVFEPTLQALRGRPELEA